MSESGKENASVLLHRPRLLPKKSSTSPQANTVLLETDLANQRAEAVERACRECWEAELRRRQMHQLEELQQEEGDETQKRHAWAVAAFGEEHRHLTQEQLVTATTNPMWFNNQTWGRYEILCPYSHAGCASVYFRSSASAQGLTQDYQHDAGGVGSGGDEDVSKLQSSSSSPSPLSACPYEVCVRRGASVAEEERENHCVQATVMQQQEEERWQRVLEDRGNSSVPQYGSFLPRQNHRQRQQQQMGGVASSTRPHGGSSCLNLSLAPTPTWRQQKLAKQSQLQPQGKVQQPSDVPWALLYFSGGVNWVALVTLAFFLSRRRAIAPGDSDDGTGGSRNDDGDPRGDHYPRDDGVGEKLTGRNAGQGSTSGSEEERTPSRGVATAAAAAAAAAAGSLLAATQPLAHNDGNGSGREEKLPASTHSAISDGGKSDRDDDVAGERIKGGGSKGLTKGGDSKGLAIVGGSTSRKQGSLSAAAHSTNSDGSYSDRDDDNEEEGKTLSRSGSLKKLEVVEVRLAAKLLVWVQFKFKGRRVWFRGKLLWKVTVSRCCFSIRITATFDMDVLLVCASLKYDTV